MHAKPPKFKSSGPAKTISNKPFHPGQPQVVHPLDRSLFSEFVCRKLLDFSFLPGCWEFLVIPTLSWKWPDPWTCVRLIGNSNTSLCCTNSNSLEILLGLYCTQNHTNIRAAVSRKPISNKPFHPGQSQVIHPLDRSLFSEVLCRELLDFSFFARQFGIFGDTHSPDFPKVQKDLGNRRRTLTTASVALGAGGPVSIVAPAPAFSGLFPRMWDKSSRVETLPPQFWHCRYDFREHHHNIFWAGR